MSLFDTAKTLVDEEKKVREAKEQQDFMEYKMDKLKALVKRSSEIALELSQTDEKAKAIEEMTFEEYKQKQKNTITSLSPFYIDPVKYYDWKWK